MIPQEKSAAVTLGLNEAFGVAEFEDIRDLTERPGSNRAFRIVVRGSAYLLRINTRPGDMKRHFACMQAAADAGLAPRVRYASPEEGRRSRYHQDWTRLIERAQRRRIARSAGGS